MKSPSTRLVVALYLEVGLDWKGEAKSARISGRFEAGRGAAAFTAA